MSNIKLFLAGSGGQGILLMGQMITHAAMLENKATTFLPSYGPEMRGGTANCTVVVDDTQVSCPIIYEADCVAAMNLPSMIKFEQLVKPGGSMFINTSIIDELPKRTDINVYKVPVNEMAMELGNIKTANMVMLGAIVRTTRVVSQKSIEQVMAKKFTGKKAELIGLNTKAFEYWQK